MGLKRCTRCGIEKDRTADFHKKQSRCKSCAVVVATEWNTQHPDKHRSHANAYGKANRQRITDATREWRLANYRHHLWQHRTYAHRRRALSALAGPTITLEQWDGLCLTYGNKCLACGSTSAELTVDHIRPLVRGGSNDISNLQPLCLSCNDKKGATEIDYRPFKYAEDYSRSTGVTDLAE